LSFPSYCPILPFAVVSPILFCCPWLQCVVRPSLIAQGKIIEKETGKKGGVSAQVYWAYVTQLGGVFIVSAVLFFAFMQNGGDIGTN
jgi:hypothetical protein